jgi:surface polysaccharide O-acyltransferase-like enzyme
MRNLPLLSGLAILAVVFNHSNWHILEQFSSPSWQAFLFIATDQLGKFAVSAFIFVAGHFIAYATNGGKRDVQWSTVRARVMGLLWPWMIWAMIFMAAQALQGRPFSIAQYINTLFVQYYFIPLLIIFYLLSPFFVRWIKADRNKTLFWAAVVQVAAMTLFYIRVYLPGFPPSLNWLVDIGPTESFRFCIFFVIGIFSGLYPAMVKQRLAPVKSWLPWLLAAAFVLESIETSLAFLHNGGAWPIGGDQTKITTVLFNLLLIFTFLAYDNLRLPYPRFLTLLSKRSYGIYVTHYIILGIVTAGVERFLPVLVSQYALYLLLLLVLTVAGSLALMEAAGRLPGKQFYRYFFN